MIEPRAETGEREACQPGLQGVLVAGKKFEKGGDVGAVPHAFEKGFGGAERAIGDDAARKTEIAYLHDGVAARLAATKPQATAIRSEEHTSELQSLMRISYAVFCLKTKKTTTTITSN